MKDYFFTLGGKYFWEDLFVYEGWRIQRNLTSRKVRLLDNWDIIRHEGNYKECFDAFTQYSKAFEIDYPQNKELIIMLHGFAQNRNIFSSLEKTLNNQGYTTAAVNYPSMQRGIKEQAEQITTLVGNLKEISSVSFITYGASNIILEEMISRQPNWLKNTPINKIIEINPLINGSKICQKLSSFSLLRFVLGKMLSDLTPDNIKKFHHKIALDIRVITTQPSWLQKLISLLLIVKCPKHSIEEIKTWCGAKSVKALSVTSNRALQSASISDAIAYFLSENKSH
ncbi:MAG: hypothetical protein IKK52_00970 [Alphaproteobacteria bacterium]|nr:hypothetical protein [Alphaproteobacteria bacterium]